MQSVSTTSTLSIRGVIIVLLTRLGLPLDICRIIYALRYADYTALQWHVMGLHYRAGAIHRYIAARPWRFTGRMRCIYQRWWKDGENDHGRRLRRQLFDYVDSHLNATRAGTPVYYKELGMPFAEALIYDTIGDNVYFRGSSLRRVSEQHSGAGVSTLNTLTDAMCEQLYYALRDRIEFIYPALELYGVALADAVIRDQVFGDDRHFRGGWTMDKLVKHVHRIWTATRPVDR